MTTGCLEKTTFGWILGGKQINENFSEQTVTGVSDAISRKSQDRFGITEISATK